eukprot:s2508_g3.t1
MRSVRIVGKIVIPSCRRQPFQTTEDDEDDEDAGDGDEDGDDDGEDEDEDEDGEDEDEDGEDEDEVDEDKDEDEDNEDEDEMKMAILELCCPSSDHLGPIRATVGVERGSCARDVKMSISTCANSDRTAAAGAPGEPMEYLGTAVSLSLSALPALPVPPAVLALPAPPTATTAQTDEEDAEYDEIEENEACVMMKLGDQVPSTYCITVLEAGGSKTCSKYFPIAAAADRDQVQRCLNCASREERKVGAQPVRRMQGASPAGLVPGILLARAVELIRANKEGMCRTCKNGPGAKRRKVERKEKFECFGCNTIKIAEAFPRAQL